LAGVAVVTVVWLDTQAWLTVCNKKKGFNTRGDKGKMIQCFNGDWTVFWAIWWLFSSSILF